MENVNVATNDDTKADRKTEIARKIFSALGIFSAALWILAILAAAGAFMLGSPRSTIFFVQECLYGASLALFTASLARTVLGIMYGLFRLAQGRIRITLGWTLLSLVSAGLLTIVLASIRIAEGFSA